MNHSTSGDGGGSVSLVGVELVDVSGGELASGSFLLKQDIEFSVSSSLGFRQTEKDPDGLWERRISRRPGS